MTSIASVTTPVYPLPGSNTASFKTLEEYNTSSNVAIITPDELEPAIDSNNDDKVSPEEFRAFTQANNYVALIDRANNDVEKVLTYSALLSLQTIQFRLAAELLQTEIDEGKVSETDIPKTAQAIKTLQDKSEKLTAVLHKLDSGLLYKNEKMINEARQELKTIVSEKNPFNFELNIPQKP